MHYNTGTRILQKVAAELCRNTSLFSIHSFITKAHNTNLIVVMLCFGKLFVYIPKKNNNVPEPMYQL